ncbi:hypothetical protein DL237_16380 [Pseudooceanicola sediminis]|uniref:Uncharacterized protein n=1 Tax=Pseudooceanicola sediminis TaxID=2211117 RepID=A0A399IXL6_9RHOB|nr:hypothetical protein DL237_16380 [Pseudooceanicola sediminis]
MSGPFCVLRLEEASGGGIYRQMTGGGVREMLRHRAIAIAEVERARAFDAPLWRTRCWYDARRGVGLFRGERAWSVVFLSRLSGGPGRGGQGAGCHE